MFGLSSGRSLIGSKLFDKVFPYPELPRFVDEEDEDDVMEYYAAYEDMCDDYFECTSAYGLPHHPAVSNFQVTKRWEKDSWKYETYRFVVGGVTYEVDTRIRVGEWTSDEELILETFREYKEKEGDT